MPENKTSISVRHAKRHWLRNSLTILIEALLFMGCMYVSIPTMSLRCEISLGFMAIGLLVIIGVTLFIPNNAYSRTARRDEIVACSMKTALAVCILFPGFIVKISVMLPIGLLFFFALTIERLIFNSWFIRYCTRPAHNEYGVIICNEETVWQQQSLQQNTYGLKLTRLIEQTGQQLTEYLALHPETESVYCAPSSLPASELEMVAHICREKGLVLHLLPQPVFALNKALQSECRGSVNVLSPIKPPLQSFFNRMVKRLTDITLSLLVLLTIFPVFAAIAFFFIKKQSRGPILVSKHMCGMNGKTFQCYTFRTRHYEAAPSFLDGINDPGYFPFGKFLTHSRLELLPQFLCVLWGSMTIVGSQMMRPEHYANYQQEMKRLFASGYRLKAGITSCHLPSQTKSSAKADVWYFRNWGFWLDMRIMFQRLGTLLRKSKAKSINYI